MSPLVEARSLVDRLAFDEYALDRIDGRFVLVAPDDVDHLNHRAIQSPHESVGRISGQFDTASRGGLCERAISSTNLFDSSAGREIEAQAQRYHRTNDERLLDIRRATFPGFAGEVEAAKRVGFPEIDPGAKPVIIVVALFEGLAPQDSFANRLLASVVAEDETRSELMQRRAGDWRSGAVIFAELAGLSVDPGLNQHLHC